jgi:hypothetical protein
MRYLALLLSVYILALTAIPCVDLMHPNQAMSQLTVEHNTQQHRDCDECSPFCSCNCCASAMVCSLPPLLTQVVVRTVPVQTQYRAPMAPNPYVPIWEPPCLG